METEPSMQATCPRKCGAHLPLDERGAIQCMRSRGMSLRQIASQLGCAHTTILKELKRSTPEKTGTRGPAPAYRAKLGQQRYRNNRLRCRKVPAVAQCGSFLVWMVWMRKSIERFKWSFDACTFTVLRTEKSAMRAVMTCSPMSAFLAPRPCAFQRYVESNALGEGRLPVSPIDLAVYLKRPAHIAPGGEFGHREIDTVVGRRAGGNAAVLTLVEKRTRYFMALPLASRSAGAVGVWHPFRRGVQKRDVRQRAGVFGAG